MRQPWEIDELVEAWTLVDDDLGLVANKTGATRLGFAVLLKFFELEARFPASQDEVRSRWWTSWRGRWVCRSTRWHGTTGRVARGSGIGLRSGRGWGSGAGPTRMLSGWLMRWCRARSAMDADGYSWRHRVRVEPPVPAKMDRHVGSAIRRWEEAAHHALMDRLGVDVAARVDALFVADRRGELTWLRTDPGAVGVDTVLSELDKLAMLDQLGLPDNLFAEFSSRMVDRWADRFDVTAPSALVEMARPARVAVTAAWLTRPRSSRQAATARSGSRHIEAAGSPSPHSTRNPNPSTCHVSRPS
jgi:hypothetical protein